MNRAHVERPTYSGAPWLPYPPPLAHPHQGNPWHGFCPSCCHPRAKCCCCRECRKEAKELLVQPAVSPDQLQKMEAADPQFSQRFRMASSSFGARMRDFADESAEPAGGAAAGPVNRVLATALPRYKLGYATAFIGGGCCVHLSIEYSPSSPSTASAVAVLVQGSDDTSLAWLKVEQPGAGYQVKEGIIATNPGADLAVIVVNMTARVRWCEIFSC